MDVNHIIDIDKQKSDLLKKDNLNKNNVKYDDSGPSKKRVLAHSSAAHSSVDFSNMWTTWRALLSHHLI